MTPNKFCARGVTLVQAGPDEDNRLAILNDYRILDTPSEPEFDRIARLAALVCQTPVAAITFIDKHRQWSKAAIGLPAEAVLRSAGMACAVDALGSERPVMVPDLSGDARLAEHPWVVAAPLLRFYAAAPLIAPDGAAIGVLEVMDHRARVLDDAQIESLETLAAQVVAQLALRRERLRSGVMPEAGDPAVHDAREIEREMLSSAERFRAVARVTADAIWDWDLQTDVLWWSDGVRKLFGLDWCDIVVHGSLWVAHIHPADRAAVVASIEHAIAGDASEWRA
jgi:GAF domain-containing protein